ncbi:integrin alpha [Hankyongella ginsenosidimutans]|nr:integrin alpha [Hankyongella ginsenosidimutans]
MADIDLTNLTPTQGFRIIGDGVGDRAGISVSNAGDVNGDGIDDLIVGADRNGAGGSYAGAAYVVYGRSGGLGNLDLTNLASADGFRIIGDAARDYAGRSVSSAGDVNGDGIDDLIVGASYNDAGGSSAGAAYVIYGRSGGLSNLDLTNLTTADGFRIIGDAVSDVAGTSVSAAGDVNGDGIDDLIVGAFLNDAGGSSAGAAYVVYGRNGGRSDLDLTNLTVADGFRIIGDAARDFAGTSVSSAGDVNGDGLDDLIVGATGNDAGGSEAGAAYVIYGRSGGRSDLDLTTLTAADGFRIIGDNSYDLVGESVSNAGDVNGDGIDDLIVGARNNDAGGTYAGAAYVIYGRNGGRSALDLTTLTAADGFRILGDAANDLRALASPMPGTSMATASPTCSWVRVTTTSAAVMPGQPMWCTGATAGAATLT